MIWLQFERHDRRSAEDQLSGNQHAGEHGVHLMVHVKCDKCTNMEAKTARCDAG